MFLKYLPVLATVSLIFGVTRIIYMFRARAMRAFAARMGFQYIGPAAPKWWNPSHPELRSFLPTWFSLTCRPSGRRIRQVWNVIEGQHNGVSVLIFDSILGEMKGGALSTFIACPTEQNPFGIVSSRDHVIQPRGRTILHGVWFLHLSWPMGIKRLEGYVHKLGVGSVCEPGR